MLAIFIFVNIRTHADVTTPDNPNNNAPTATITSIVATATSSTVSVDAPLTLVAGATVPVKVVGSFVDADGCSQVTTGGRVDALLQRGSVTSCISSGFMVSDGGNSCYAVQGCTITDCSGTTANFECDFNVAYNADATDLGEYSADQWTAFVSPLDQTMLSSGSTDNTSPGYTSAHFEVALSPGIAAGHSVSFGSLAFGAVSAQQTLDVEDAGNTPLTNISVESSPLLCRHNDSESPGASGTIPPENVYAAGSPAEIGSMTALSSSTPLQFGLNIPVATTTASSTKPVYMRLQFPSDLVAGVCTGAVTVGIE